MKLRGINALSDRQRVILDLFAEGMLAKQVAAYMHLSTETIKWHLTQIRRKLGARNTTHAVAIYIRGQRLSERGCSPRRESQQRLKPAESRSESLRPKDSGPAADLPLVPPPTPLVHRLSFKIIDKARKWRIVL